MKNILRALFRKKREFKKWEQPAKSFEEQVYSRKSDYQHHLDSLSYYLDRLAFGPLPFLTVKDGTKSQVRKRLINQIDEVIEKREIFYNLTIERTYKFANN